MESVAHITVQIEMERKLREESKVNMTGREFLRYLHCEFYQQLPEEFRVVTNPETGRERLARPGELREESVKVGYHQPPGHSSLKAFLDRFGEFYTPDRHHGALKLVATAAAHHRLMWVHPFLDGNGRVARLFTEAYFHRIPVHGFGLWRSAEGWPAGTSITNLPLPGLMHSGGTIWTAGGICPMKG
jgi:Fic family protein